MANALPVDLCRRVVAAVAACEKSICSADVSMQMTRSRVGAQALPASRWTLPVFASAAIPSIGRNTARNTIRQRSRLTLPIGREQQART